MPTRTPVYCQGVSAESSWFSPIGRDLPSQMFVCAELQKLRPVRVGTVQAAGLCCLQPCSLAVFALQGGTTHEALQPQAATFDDTSSTPAAATPTATLPSHIRSEQYSAAAFQADPDSSSTTRPQDADSIISSRDPSTLLQAVLDGTLGLTATIRLLEQDHIPPAALLVDCLVGVLSAWQADWAAGSARAWQSAGGADWQSSPVLQWANQHWDDLTAEQVKGLRDALAVEHVGDVTPFFFFMFVARQAVGAY